MIEVFRIVKAKYAATAFSGEAAKLYPGRWNHYGTQAIYTSASLALATLELIVQLEALPPSNYIQITATIPNLTIVHELKKLPSGWDSYPFSHATQDLGMHWVKNNISAVLKVPSVIIPTEFNYIINPNHLDFKKIIIGKPQNFIFDRRLWQKKEKS